MFLGFLRAQFEFIWFILILFAAFFKCYVFLVIEVAVKAKPCEQVFGQFIANLSSTVFARFELSDVLRKLEVDLGDAQSVIILTCSAVDPVRSDFPDSVLVLRLVEFELDHGQHSNLRKIILTVKGVLVEHKISERVNDHFTLVQLNVLHVVCSVPNDKVCTAFNRQVRKFHLLFVWLYAPFMVVMHVYNDGCLAILDLDCADRLLQVACVV